MLLSNGQLERHRNVSKQTNMLQGDNLQINFWETMKPPEEFWTHTVSQFLFLQWVRQPFDNNPRLRREDHTQL